MNPLPFPREELSITRKLSPAEACNLAGRLTGSPVTDATEMSAFVGNQVFRLRRDDGPVAFLKLADDLDLRRELAVRSCWVILGTVGLCGCCRLLLPLCRLSVNVSR